jgi:hypothetical protein
VTVIEEKNYYFFIVMFILLVDHAQRLVPLVVNPS